MLLRMNRDSFVCTCAILIVFIAEIGLFSVSSAQARSAQGSAAAKATFQSKCAMCHGPDGAGSEVGKSMKVPDARSGNFGRQGWNAPVQEFAQRGPDSRFGDIHSFAAPKEIVRTLVSGVSPAAVPFDSPGARPPAPGSDSRGTHSPNKS